MAHKIIHLGDMLEEVGEDGFFKSIANFSCPLDADIEFFLKNKAVTYQKSGLSSTYLVYSLYKGEYELSGYFSIALKPLTIDTSLSRSFRKKMTGPNETLSEIGTYLIGQLSKNYNLPIANHPLQGEELLYMACKKIKQAAYLSGGRIILVECRDIPQLKQFYEKYGFRLYKENTNDKLLKYIRNIKDIKL